MDQQRMGNGVKPSQADSIRHDSSLSRGTASMGSTTAAAVVILQSKWPQLMKRTTLELLLGVGFQFAPTVSVQ